MVHGAGRVDLGLVLARHVGQLGAGQDIEVIVGGVTAGVTLGSDGGSEDDQVLGDTLKSREKKKVISCAPM